MTLAVGRFVRVAPSEAWALISRTGCWPRWGPSVSAVEPADTELSLGLRGRVRTPFGLWFPFRITEFDPPRSWAWSVILVPATSHRVEPAHGGCRVSFAVPATEFAYLAVCRLALERIAELLEAPSER
ncbi:MAG: SRPBCC family protein [Solirubrobacteraceae bacterium]